MILLLLNHRLRILILPALLFFVFPVSAQLYNFRTYSLDDGLSQSEVNCIYEDSRGYLWIGTSGGGLNMFDGKEFKTYEEKDGLCGQIISAIGEDAHHNLLIGTQFNSLCRFDGHQFTKLDFQISQKAKRGNILFIETDDNNNIIIGKNNVLLLYDGTNFRELKAANDTSSHIEILCSKKDSRNLLWIGTTDGLFVLKNKTLIKIENTNGITDAAITALTEDVNGNIWAVEKASVLHKIRITGPSHYQVAAEIVDSIHLPEHTQISAIHFDQHNQLWIATLNKGLFKFQNDHLSNFTQENGLPVDDIKKIYEDRTGNLWFGTIGGGLVKFTDQAFTYFDNVPGLNQHDIFSLAADHSGNIWAGTSLHGLYRYNGKISENVTAAAGIGDVEVRAIFTDSKNDVWIGTNEGIVIYSNNHFHKYKYPQVKNVRVIFEDASGNIWIGTKGSYVFLDDGKTVRQIKEPEGLNCQYAYSFVQDLRGNIWIGTGCGIYIYNDGKVAKHISEGLCNVYAGSMVKDKFGTIWVGTDNCVAYYDGTGFKNINTTNGLTSGTVYLLNYGKYDNVWVGTNKGLDRIILNEKGEIASIRNYGKAEGFRGVECNSRATCVDNNGCLWFGTIKGAIRFDPDEEKMRKRESPSVHLTDIKLFYETIDAKKYSDSVTPWYGLPATLNLPHNANHITFDFLAISKSFPENIRYSFKLEGFDKEWSPPSSISSATYSNLPPNQYVFKVKALNKDGMESPVPAEFMFVIAQPFWNTWWFIALSIICFVAFLYGYNEYRKRKQKRYLERLEKIIRQRTAEVIKQRDENEILLKEVHHRVKNNLQIINSLINIQSDYVNDPKSSELFREIRNRIRTISLVHEKLYKSDDYGKINVKEYINMLVENLIDTYSMNMDIQLKLDLEVQHFNLNTIIPLGLLLNEIISNSFKYAFNDKESGIIEITLHKSTIEDKYTIIIGDNGAGFDDRIFNSKNPTLGLELVKILASQLNGTIEKIQKPGTYYILKFSPLKD